MPKNSSNKVARSWTFTDFDVSDESKQFYDDIDVKFIVYGLEAGGETGRPHLQGFVTWCRGYRLTALKKLRPKVHWEAAKACDAGNYCMKEGKYTKRDYRRQGTRSDLEECKKIIDEGKTWGEVASAHFGTFVRYHRGLMAYKSAVTGGKLRDDPPEVVWIYGESGTGKTRYVHDRTESKDLWVSSGGDLKWFDGYDGQETALLDDFRHEHCKFTFLLRLLDRYKLRVAVKGGFVNWVPKTIFLTSIEAPEVEFAWMEPRLRKQLMRRITSVMHME